MSDWGSLSIFQKIKHVLVTGWIPATGSRLDCPGPVYDPSLPRASVLQRSYCCQCNSLAASRSRSQCRTVHWHAVNPKSLMFVRCSAILDEDFEAIDWLLTEGGIPVNAQIIGDQVRDSFLSLLTVTGVFCSTIAPQCISQRMRTSCPLVRIMLAWCMARLFAGACSQASGRARRGIAHSR